MRFGLRASGGVWCGVGARINVLQIRVKGTCWFLGETYRPTVLPHTFRLAPATFLLFVPSTLLQPINYKFDHSYVLDAMKRWPGKFKGMCLANPSLSPNDACTELERLNSQGFCGVRFNPYLWPEGGEGMKDDTGLALYRKAGELSMPVGVMCFKGFGRHVKEIEALLASSPQTKLVVDHFGFFLQDGIIDEAAWEEILSLAEYPSVYIKTSALFRVAKDPYPYESLRPRFAALMKHFGSRRLLWGSDFPFVSDGQCGYGPAKDVVCNGMGLTDEEVHDITGGTARSLFGTWAQDA
ncbi:unnamed protein product [Scytosiphon promiscuus]